MLHCVYLLCLPIALTVAHRASITPPQTQSPAVRVHKCTPDHDCSITCTTSSSCSDSVIECPVRGSCNIECLGTKSCQNLVVNASQSQYGNVNVWCENNEVAVSDHGDHDQCNGLKVYGSVMNTNTADVSIVCNGDLYACYAMGVFCPLHGDCLLACNGESACAHSAVRGPEYGDLIMSCTAPSSCLSATLDARYSELMELTGCLADASCTDLSVYVPPNTNSTANCFMQGNDNLQISQLYASHGWTDIDFSYAGSFALSAHAGSVMHCGDGYHDTCTMAADAWSCAHEGDACSAQVLLDGDGHDDDHHVGDSHEFPDGDDEHGDDTGYYYVPDQRRDFESGAVGMLIIGGILIALVIVCIVCGGLKKAHGAATRKLSDMGWKSPFKSPRKQYVEQQQYMQQVASADNISSYMDPDCVEQSVDSTLYPPTHDVRDAGAAAAGGHKLHRPESHTQTHTAHIHRPNSHSTNYTAAIHRPNSASATGSTGGVPMPGSAHSSASALHAHAAEPTSTHGHGGGGGAGAAGGGVKLGGYKVVQKYAGHGSHGAHGQRRSSRHQQHAPPPHNGGHGRVSRHDARAHAVRAAVHGHVGHDERSHAHSKRGGGGGKHHASEMVSLR